MIDHSPTTFVHELNQVLMIINTYLLGCIKRLEKPNVNIEQIIIVMHKIIKQVDLLSKKIQDLKNINLPLH
jgi:phosphoglycerate-specific signal transduction histidine kinase